jgi:uncharacterized protein
MTRRLNQLPWPLSVSALLLISLSSQAASFDCAKAASVTEKTICADGALSKLDSDLSIAWKNALDVSVDPTALNSTQSQWLKLRNSCGGDSQCLSARYNARLTALAGARSAVMVDRAGNRMEAMIEEAGTSSTGHERRCTADKHLCVEVIRDNADSPPLVQVDVVGANSSTHRFELQNVPDIGQNISVTLWPRVLRLADASDTILIGLKQSSFTAYSGGGGSSTELRLFEVSRDRSAFRDREVLAVPIAGSLTIRACFDERDARRRLGACHDIYDFTAMLALDPTVKSSFFPGKVSRDKDSLDAAPLRKRNLVTAVDQQCTYKRKFDFNAAQGVYVPDHPLPDCSDYTVP